MLTEYIISVIAFYIIMALAWYLQQVQDDEDIGQALLTIIIVGLIPFINVIAMFFIIITVINFKISSKRTKKKMLDAIERF